VKEGVRKSIIVIPLTFAISHGLNPKMKTDRVAPKLIPQGERSSIRKIGRNSKEGIRTGETLGILRIRLHNSKSMNHLSRMKKMIINMTYHHCHLFINRKGITLQTKEKTDKRTVVKRGKDLR
jgi:hypothetical protein